MTWMDDPAGGAERREWYAAGRRAFQSGEARSLTEIPEPSYGSVYHADGCKMAWMAGFTDARLEAHETLMRHLAEYRANYDHQCLAQLLGESPEGVVRRDRPASEQVEFRMHVNDMVSPELQRLMEQANEAYRARSPEPEPDEPEVVNPGSPRRRAIEV